ncbi:MAG: hypothetical protein KGJ06_03080, partial [Pseudomonadota bacterium]|nr:hypothetical protein [Pseudomonadota bacterium]
MASSVSRREFDQLAQEHAVLKNAMAASGEEKLRLASELTEYRERAIGAEMTIQNNRQNEQYLQLQIKQMASAMFEEYGNKFSQHSEKKLESLLDPLRNRLGEFQKLVTDSFTTQGKEQYSLKAE